MIEARDNACAEPWTRIPAEIESEADRRTLCAIIASCGLEVRIVRVRLTQRGTPKKFIEYRANGNRIITEE